MLKDILHLFYPKLCYGCDKALQTAEKHLCLLCHAHLPKTNWHHDKGNPLAVKLGSRIDLRNATAYLYFNKGETVQHLLHKLKYKGKHEIGLFIGTLMGNELMENADYSAIDAIVPVPLHWTKEKRRGYNQSEIFASGLSSAMNRPVLSNIIERKIATDTQTHKNRYSRWENVENIFVLTPMAEEHHNKHFLLVDDVVTTGATLEASANKLLKISGTSLSIATIAYA